MRLVLREYLSMLRESGELDALLPDLLLAMDLVPLSRPAVGPRQFGVDLPAVGVDPDDGQQKLFLLTVKQGDITRNDWDTGKQAVRPSLNEILDSYLRTRVRPEHEALPKKIILATGGELRQDVEPDWVNYVHAHTGPHPRYGQIQIEFWGGDRLAQLIERFVLDEYLFPESAQKNLRKTIALADQNEAEPRYFYALIENALFAGAVPAERTAAALRRRQKTLRMLNLSLGIVFHWCREVGNLLPAVLCGEHMALRVWDYMRAGDLLDCQGTQREFGRIFGTYLSIGRAYAAKLDPHCRVRDGLFGYGADEVEYPVRVMEVIGILGTIAAGFAYTAAASEQEEAERELTAHAAAVADTLAALIDNNPPSRAPAYDGHAIDISLGLIALVLLGFRKQAREWVEPLVQRVVFAYRIGRYFPISSDSFEDLVALYMTEGPGRDALKQKLMQLSTLLPTLAEWHAVLGADENYVVLRDVIRRFLAAIDLQLWYPDDATDAHLYARNAGLESGFTRTSIELPPRLEELAFRMVEIRDHERSLDRVSCVRAGWPVLALIASRHFRTPVLPGFWQEMLDFAAPSTRP